MRNAKGQTPKAKDGLEGHKIEDLLATPSSFDPRHSTFLHVIQDRLLISADNKPRFLEACEAALHFGKGTVNLFAALGVDAGHPLHPGSTQRGAWNYLRFSYRPPTRGRGYTV